MGCEYSIVGKEYRVCECAIVGKWYGVCECAKGIYGCEPVVFEVNKDIHENCQRQ